MIIFFLLMSDILLCLYRRFSLVSGKFNSFCMVVFFLIVNVVFWLVLILLIVLSELILLFSLGVLLYMEWKGIMFELFERSKVVRNLFMYVFENSN